MKNVLKKSSLLLIFLFSTNAIAQTGYVCIADKAAGFSFDTYSKTWNNANFKVSDSKYVLSKSGGSWQWKKMGESYPSSCGEFSEYGYLKCDNGFTQVSFNKKNLRYMKSYLVGYVNGGIAGKEGEDTPNIEIGKCSPI
jgi:hypothetical protein